MSRTQTQRELKRSSPSTIQDKFLVGYQGWFTCGGDGVPIAEGHHGWLHWLTEPLNPEEGKGRVNTDLWPDVSAYPPECLYEIEGLKHNDGSGAKVFSSRSPAVVNQHFRWMAEHGVDGAFLQRFVGAVDPEEEDNKRGLEGSEWGGTLRFRDEVGKRVQDAAEKEGRVWAIMYDVTGMQPDDLIRILTSDFTHLLRTERIFDSPAYLHEQGKPVLAVWGLGMGGAAVSASDARRALSNLRTIYRDFTHGDELYIFAGTPSHWREPGVGDSQPDPTGEWERLWLGANGEVDAISPWSGRYNNMEELEHWTQTRSTPDAELIASHNANISQHSGRHVDYIPVVLPGGSGFNTSSGNWPWNGIPRHGGRFLWKQILQAKRCNGVRSIYGAMWDEYDEGTVFLPVVNMRHMVPKDERFNFMALDEDGWDLPGDWYMRVAGLGAELLRNERSLPEDDELPKEELDDYWSQRPKYGDGAVVSGAEDSSQTVFQA